MWKLRALIIKSIGARSVQVSLVFLFVAASPACRKTVTPGANPGATSKAYDFVEVVPPTTLYPPGTIVAIRRVKPATSLDIICDRDSATGKDPKIASSVSVDAEAKRKATAGGNLDITTLKLLGVKADLKRIKNVTYRLGNLRVEELTGNAAVKAEKQRDPDCVEAVDRARRDGQQITMVKTAWIADVVYSVEFDSSANLSVEAKQGLVRDIAGSLGIDTEIQGSDSFSGKGLIWGIRDNANYVEPKRFGFGDPDAVTNRSILAVGEKIFAPVRPHRP